MQRFFETVIEPIFELEGIKNIVEIGADKGFNTAKLISYVNKWGGKIYSIDPAPSFDSAKWEQENPDSFVMIKDLSLNTIKNITGAECFLIDGDHNWYTVYSELTEIFKIYGKEKFPLIFFHDILWPYDRRDLYYSPETIPEIYRHEYEQKAISPDSKVLTDIGINGGLFNAKEYGGDKSGVLTAVEDFVGEHPELKLELLTQDVLFGLGMIASKEKFGDAREYFYSAKALKGAMQLCERERVEQAVKINAVNKRLKQYTDHNRKLHIGKIYPDFGEGFSEKTSVLGGDYNKESDSFYIEISFEKAPKVIRFDPVNASYCIASNVVVIGDDGIIEPEQTNGIKYGNSYIFKNKDPRIIYKNLNGSRSFKIKADIYPFESISALTVIDEMLTENNSLTVEKDRLQNENSTLAAEKDRLEIENTRKDVDISELGKAVQSSEGKLTQVKVEAEKEIEEIKNKFNETAKKNSTLSKELINQNKELGRARAVIRSNNELSKQFVKAGSGIGYKYALKTVLKHGFFAAKTNIKAIKKLRSSGEFDLFSYCKKYNDVLQCGMDPLIHFIWFGGYEGRDPSDKFSSRKYLAAYEDVRKSGVNPYAHFVVLGRQEGRKALGADEKKSAAKETVEKNKLVNAESSVNVMDRQGNFHYRKYCYTLFSDRLKKLREEIITIIVPVYNAYEETKECIEYVLMNTDFPYRLMLINDCSTDERIVPLLKKYEGNENVIIVQNEKNLGFVGTTNYGITHSENDVVFLNSDTKVTKGWLRKLAIAAYHIDNVATVTPFSNAAGAFSVPVMGENKDMPDGFDLEAMSVAVERSSELDYVNVPTGNGYCMYVTRKAIDKVGILDVEAFSRGYGEENDFCMRAKNAGFINIIADDTYIYHKRSASFKEEKQQLITNNRKILDERYPSYSREIKIFSESELLKANRSRIKEIVDNDFSLPLLSKRILYVLHEGIGGTVKTNEDLMKFVQKNNYEVFMLTSNASQMKLYSVTEGILNLLHIWELNTTWDIANFYVSEYADIYFDVICNLHIDLIHIRHLFKHSFDVVEIADSLGIPVIMSFHDFYFICPTINLVNSDNKYCDAVCRECDDKCRINSKLIKIDYPINKWTLEIWRKEVKKILSNVKAFVTTSEYTRITYLKIYPDIEERFFVIEHGRDFPYNRDYRGQKPDKNKIKILLAGNIDINKGGQYIKKLIDLDTEQRLEFHCIGALIGETAVELDTRVVVHGKYIREDFVKLVSEIKPAYIGIFSIWPETYCHVLTEAWSCGVPCIVSDIGTLKERAEAHGGCIRADLNAPEKTLREIIDISSSWEKYQKLCSEVQKADIHSIDRMGTEYLTLYHKVVNKNSDPIKIILWVNNFVDKRVASSFIRVVSPVVMNPVVRKRAAVAELHHISDIPFGSKLISGIYVLVQREKIDKDSVTLLCEKAEECNDKLKIIFEIDDDLLSIEADHPEYALYKENISKIQVLSQIASKVIVTNEIISDSLNAEKNTIPNFIDNRLWNIRTNEPSVQDRKSYKILYFGTTSHKNDLLVMREPMRILNQKLKKVEKHAGLAVVGCADAQESWYEGINVPSEFKEYPQFVKWLKGVNDFDIGIAPLGLDNKLNYAKSYLKYLEYSALGLPCVCTDIKPYGEVVKNGETGFLIKDNSAEEWAEVMYRLLTDIGLRERIIRNARDDIKKNHMLSDHYKEIADVILDME